MDKVFCYLSSTSKSVSETLTSYLLYCGKREQNYELQVVDNTGCLLPINKVSNAIKELVATARKDIDNIYVLDNNLVHDLKIVVCNRIKRDKKSDDIDEIEERQILSKIFDLIPQKQKNISLCEIGSKYRTPSLEDRFHRVFLAKYPNLPSPQREYKFHPDRKWRFDFAWPLQKVAVEIQGGSFISGKHSRGTQQHKDYEKYNNAALLGWRILYFDTQMIGTLKDNKISDCVDMAAYTITGAMTEREMHFVTNK